MTMGSIPGHVDIWHYVDLAYFVCSEPFWKCLGHRTPANQHVCCYGHVGGLGFELRPSMHMLIFGTMCAWHILYALRRPDDLRCFSDIEPQLIIMYAFSMFAIMAMQEVVGSILGRVRPMTHQLGKCHSFTHMVSCAVIILSSYSHMPEGSGFDPLPIFLFLFKSMTQVMSW